MEVSRKSVLRQLVTKHGNALRDVAQARCKLPHDRHHYLHELFLAYMLFLRHYASLCNSDDLQKNGLSKRQGPAITRRKLLKHKLKFVLLHAVFFFEAKQLKQDLQAVFEGAAGVDNQNTEQFKHVDFNALSEPFEIVKLDLLVHCGAQDAFFEVLRDHEQRLAVVLPPLDQDHCHFARYVTSLNGDSKQVRIGPNFIFIDVAHLSLFCNVKTLTFN